WSPDGKRLASASASADLTIGEVKVWDADNGQESLALKAHTDVVWSVSWSPDGKRLASASDDQTVRLWETERGQETLSLNGPMEKVRSVCWSPDGKRLASAGGWRDGKQSEWGVKVWDGSPRRGSSP